MKSRIVWSKVILEEFIRLACLSETEEMIMRTRVAGWTVTKQAMTFNMSTATVSRHIKNIKAKYDECQKYSAILPPRKHSAKEDYMDNN